MKIGLAGKRAIAKGLTGAGAKVVVTDRTQATIDKAVSAISEKQPDAQISGVAGDLSTHEGVTELITTVPQADILVNNPGIYSPKPLFEIDDADWDHIFNVNVTNAVRLARHFAP